VKDTIVRDVLSALSNSDITLNDIKDVITHYRIKARAIEKRKESPVSRNMPWWPPHVGKRRWGPNTTFKLWCKECGRQIELTLVKGDPLSAHRSICCGARLLRERPCPRGTMSAALSHNPMRKVSEKSRKVLLIDAIEASGINLQEYVKDGHETPIICRCRD